MTDDSGIFGRIAKHHRNFTIIIASMAVGAITNLVVLFALVFVTGGEASTWVGWYFGNDGWYFFSVTVVIALIVFPKVRKLKLV